MPSPSAAGGEVRSEPEALLTSTTEATRTGGTVEVPLTPAEHPTEVARRALLEAADVESGVWPDLLTRFAKGLPDRSTVEPPPALPENVVRLPIRAAATSRV